MPDESNYLKLLLAPLGLYRPLSWFKRVLRASDWEHAPASSVVALVRNIMRPLIPAFVVATSLLTASAALAAPTCQDINGETIRCGTPGAMPVGWTLSPQQRLERQISRPKYPSTNEILELIAIMGVFFTLLALMPEFDGQRTRDWGEQEGDREEPE